MALSIELPPESMTLSDEQWRERSKEFSESLTAKDYMYWHKPKRGYPAWNIKHYRGTQELSFDNNDVESVKIKLTVTKGISSYQVEVDNIPPKDIQEGDIFIIYLGYEESGYRKVIGGFIEKARRETTADKDVILVEGKSWGNVLLENTVLEVKYYNVEASDIVKDIVKDITSTLPTIDENRITVKHVQSTGTNLDITFHEGTTYFDCILEIAELVGYDFFVDANKNLHFYPEGAYLAHLEYTDLDDYSYYEDTTNLYNVVTVVGKKGEMFIPSDKDEWTEYEDPGAKGWSISAEDSTGASVTASFTTPLGQVGDRCVQGEVSAGIVKMEIQFTVPSPPINAASGYSDKLVEYINVPDLEIELRLQKDASNYFTKTFYKSEGWQKRTEELDTADWTTVGTILWEQIYSIKWIFRYYSAKFGTGKFDVSRFDRIDFQKPDLSYMTNAIDGLHFISGCIYAHRIDQDSIDKYNRRSKVIYDETIEKQSQADLLASRYIREWAWPKFTVEDLIIDPGDELIDAGYVIRVRSELFDRELKVVEATHDLVEDYTNKLILGNPVTRTETRLTQLEKEVSTLEAT